LFLDWNLVEGEVVFCGVRGKKGIERETMVEGIEREV